MKYTTVFKSTSALDKDTRQQMAGLYLANYDGCDQHQFDHDLDDKDEVLLVYAEQKLIGFTTFRLYERSWNNASIRVIYSGDTIMDRQHWGQQALAFAWIRRMGEIKRQQPDIPFYWFLLVKGHRTFRYMPVFGKSFFPHWSANRDDLKPLADMLAHEQFGMDYNPMTGVVEFPVSHGHLNPDIADPSPKECNTTAVQFFLERNPGYKLGHELVCICEMEHFNMKPLTRRLFSQPADQRDTLD